MSNTAIIICRIKLAAMMNCRSVGYRQSGMVSVAKDLGFFTNTNDLEKNWLEFLEKNVTSKNCNEVLDILLNSSKAEKFST
ncbi:hypothetical protein [Giesbergeria anulus]|uniref:Uncharacterized protein n=1 Tax=Giesbergeria anulus TaxID=180197 RepID=A0A1H9NC58_9BURK|nr:hypothetical protein [Giesbergeria anulus]SER33534.1 hypothetical protein SAMN02982919_02167 [Giesbergeria anulus]